MFWVIVLGLSLPGPQGKPITAPILMTPSVAYVGQPQCMAAVKVIVERTGSKSLGCAQVVVAAKGAESF